MALRTLIVDDQALMRAGFRMILEADEGVEVIGEATDGVEGVRLARELRPDVVVMDIRMPRVDGIEATRQIVAEGGEDPPRVIILTTFDDNDNVYEALRAGASGFLLKDVVPDQLVSAVHVVGAGEALLTPSVTRRVIEEFARTPPPGTAPDASFRRLTARELEVFKQVARGLSNAEIAAELVVSETTVKTHVARMLSKLGLRGRVQAVVLAYESGIVTPSARVDSR